MSRTTVIALPLAIRVSPRSICARQNQLRLPSLTSRQDSVRDATLCISNQKVKLSCGGDVQSHDVREVCAVRIDEGEATLPVNHNPSSDEHVEAKYSRTCNLQDCQSSASELYIQKWPGWS
jgi:hypothetical protein